MWDEDRIRALAGSQHGVIGSTDLLGIGVSRKEIARRLLNRRGEAMHPGVYYLDSVPATWKTMVLAGVVAAGPDALASHRTSARLWELDAIYGSMIEVTVPYAESPEPDGVIVHRTRRANPATMIEAIPITPPERTLFDLAPIVPPAVLFKAARSAIAKGLTTVERLDTTIGQFGGRGVSGTRRMRWLRGELADDQSGSVSEIDLKYLIYGSPVPRPVQQLRVRRPNGVNAYPDFSWPELMKIVEVDGFGAHGTPQQLQEDLQRQNDLMDLGWEIRRFTATEIREDPDRVRSDIIRFILNRSVKVFYP